MIPETIGRYLVREELGRGGMATVFRAVDPRFKRDVAIKVLPRQFMHDPTFRTRFEREAQTIAALEHPAIVPVYDFGEEDEQPYLVMRLMPGGTLAEKLYQGAIPLTQIATILGWLAPALDEAHRHNIIHRDLKPSNILFDQWGKAYLSDFGIVKLVEGSEGKLTNTSTALGTPAYMSPEQVLGEGKLDSRSDIYALGVILFEMLTGRKPYVADTPMGQALKHVTDTIPQVQKFNPLLPPECQVVVTKAMAKDRDKRYQTAVELAAAILPIAGITPSSEILVWSEVRTPATPLPTPTPTDLSDGDEATSSVVLSKPLAASHEPLVGNSEQSAVNSEQLPVSSDSVLSPQHSTLNTQHSTDPTRVIVKTPTRGVKPVAILPPDPARLNHPVAPLAAASPTPSARRRLPNWAIVGIASLLIFTFVVVSLLRNNQDADGDSTPTQSAAFLPPPTLIFTLEPSRTPSGNATPEPDTPTSEPVASPTLRPHFSLPTTPVSPDNLEQVRGLTFWGLGIPNEVAFSPTGNRLAVATTEHLLIYAVVEGQVELPPLMVVTLDTVLNTLAYSPDGTLIATGDTDSQVILWSAETGEQLQVLAGHENWIRTVAFSPDGAWLASGSSDTAVRLWPLVDGAAGESQELLGFETTVWGVAFSPDSQTLAVGLNDNSIRLLDITNPENRQTLEGHSGRVFAVTFSPDGTKLASASSDTTARLWDVSTGESLTSFEGHVGWLRSVVFTPDGEHLITGSYDQTIRIWAVDNDSEPIIQEGHKGLVVHTAISPDGRLIATASADGTVRLWAGEDGEPLGAIQDGTGRVVSLAIDSEGEIAAAGNYDGSIRLWQLATGEPVLFLAGHRDWVRAVTFSPEGLFLASGSDDRTVYIWDMATGEIRYTLIDHPSLIRTLAFAPDSTHLYVGLGDGSARLWTLGTDTATYVEILPAQPEGATSVVFSPDNTLIATGTETGQVRLWRASDGSLVYDLVNHTDRINALTFSPDGQYLVSASSDGTVRLWRVSDGQNQTLWQPSAAEPVVFTSLGYSPDGTLLLAGTEIGEIIWLDPTRDRIWQIQDEHSQQVRSFVFTPDQTILLSGSDDGTVVLWGIGER